MPCLFVAMSLGLGGCGGEGANPFGLTGPALQSLPTVREQTAGALTMTSGSITAMNSLKKFFKLECYIPETGESFCPEGIDYLTGGEQSPYKLTDGTLVGAIYHADLYSGGLRLKCLRPVSNLTAASFVAAGSGGSATRYLLDYYGLLTCGGAETWEGAPRTSLYSIDPAGTYQATLTTRYRAPSAGSTSPGQTDIFQVYVALTAGTPTFLAFNYASASSYFQRYLLLVNLVDHKFAIKRRTNAPDYRPTTIVAVGRGGIDRATGTQHPGYFWVDDLEADMIGTTKELQATGCVNNADNTFQPDNTKCVADGVPLPGSTWTSSTSIADYLGMAAADRTRLAGFLARFNDATPLVEADSPSNNTTDPEQNFPKTLTP